VDAVMGAPAALAVPPPCPRRPAAPSPVLRSFAEWESAAPGQGLRSRRRSADDAAMSDSRDVEVVLDRLPPLLPPLLLRRAASRYRLRRRPPLDALVGVEDEVDMSGVASGARAALTDDDWGLGRGVRGHGAAQDVGEVEPTQIGRRYDWRLPSRYTCTFEMAHRHWLLPPPGGARTGTGACLSPGGQLSRGGSGASAGQRGPPRNTPLPTANPQNCRRSSVAHREQR